MSLIEETPVRQVRMANLAIVGTHSTNGVAEIHSRLLREKTVADFAEMFPERFNNKTNGVTPRRWLLLANPDLARLLTDAIGEAWITDLDRLRTLRDLADDAGFRERFRAGQARRQGPVRRLGQGTSTASTSTRDSIFDSQVKRIHEYKRQLLNVLHIIVLYHRLRSDSALRPAAADVLLRRQGRAGLPAGQADHQADQRRRPRPSTTIRASRGRLKVVFLPNYSVSLAERLIPASDVSEQISTAGYEASGTSNMKFMMNGALDHRHARRRHDRDRRGGRRGEHLPLRPDRRGGRLEPLLVQPALALRPRAGDPRRARPALQRARSIRASRDSTSRSARPCSRTATHYMHLADLASYVQAQERLGTLYRAGPLGMDPQGDPQRRGQRPVLHRSHDHASTPARSGTPSLARFPESNVMAEPMPPVYNTALMGRLSTGGSCLQSQGFFIGLARSERQIHEIFTQQ